MSRYQALAESIRTRIISGDLKPGDKLPSISQLTQQFQVSYGTVRGAMLTLKAQGLVEGRQGEGVFVKERAA